MENKSKSIKRIRKKKRFFEIWKLITKISIFNMQTIIINKNF